MGGLEIWKNPTWTAHSLYTIDMWLRNFDVKHLMPKDFVKIQDEQTYTNTPDYWWRFCSYFASWSKFANRSPTMWCGLETYLNPKPCRVSLTLLFSRLVLLISLYTAGDLTWRSNGILFPLLWNLFCGLCVVWKHEDRNKKNKIVWSSVSISMSLLYRTPNLICKRFISWSFTDLWCNSRQSCKENERDSSLREWTDRLLAENTQKVSAKETKKLHPQRNGSDCLLLFSDCRKIYKQENLIPVSEKEQTDCWHYSRTKSLQRSIILKQMEVIACCSWLHCRKMYKQSSMKQLQIVLKSGTTSDYLHFSKSCKRTQQRQQQLVCCCCSGVSH